jgi:Divergent InlB B-repeat domain
MRRALPVLLGVALCTIGLSLASPALALGAAPSAMTVLAYSTSATAGTVEGVVNPGGESAHYQAAYGLASSEWCNNGGTGTPEHTTALEALSHTEAGLYPVEASLSGLSAGSKYCAEIVAENASAVADGGQVSFTAGAPTAITLEPLSITSGAVIMAGAIDPASQPTHYHFEAGLASSEWCTSHGASGTPGFTGELHELEYSGGGFRGVLVGLGGLSSGTKYCEEVIAENATGVAHGGQVTFTAGAPAVETRTASSTGPTTATVAGEIDPASQTSYYRVEYGRASSQWCTSEGSAGSPEGSSARTELGFSDEEFHPVTVNLSGLQPNTTYCAQLVGENASGTGEGFQLTFTTERAPLAVTLKAFATGTSTAILEGEIDPEGQSARYDVEYAPATSEWCKNGGTSGAHSVSEPQVMLPYSDASFHPVKVELRSLTAGSEYCAALVAIGNASALSGKQVRFTTNPAYAVTVTLVGTGHGTVSGAGIACPGTCASSYPSGTAVSLTATAASASTFAGWGGACSGTGACTLTLSADLHVTATFTANPSPGSPSPPAPTELTKAEPELVVPSSNFTLKGAPHVNPKTGAVTLKASVSDPGVFSWFLSFKNGSFGVLARRTSCKRNQVKLEGKCRQAQVVFGKGAMTLTTGGTATFTVPPSAAARRALQAALKKGQGLSVSALLTFRASGPATAVSHTYSLTVSLKASGKSKHGR